jgi:hypothetical protein
MKHFFTVVGVAISIVALLVGCIFLFRSRILQTDKYGSLRILIQMFAPPNDLYEVLARKEVSLIKSQQVTLKYHHRYVGKHAIEFYPVMCTTDITLGDWEQYWENHASAHFLVDGREVASRDLKDVTEVFSRKGYGLLMTVYSIPKDLPLRGEVTVQFELPPYDASLLRGCEKAHLLVRKFSDM